MYVWLIFSNGVMILNAGPLKRSNGMVGWFIIAEFAAAAATNVGVVVWYVLYVDEAIEAPPRFPLLRLLCDAVACANCSCVRLNAAFADCPNP